MKKIWTIVMAISLAFTLWVGISFAEIAINNKMDYEWNFFNVVINAVSDNTITATVDRINHEENTLGMLDEEGHLWYVEVVDTNEFKIGQTCEITFDSLGDADPYNDEVIDIK